MELLAQSEIRPQAGRNPSTNQSPRQRTSPRDLIRLCSVAQLSPWRGNDTGGRASRAASPASPETAGPGQRAVFGHPSFPACYRVIGDRWRRIPPILAIAFDLPCTRGSGERLADAGGRL